MPHCYFSPVVLLLPVLWMVFPCPLAPPPLPVGGAVVIWWCLALLPPPLLPPYLAITYLPLALLYGLCRPCPCWDLCNTHTFPLPLPLCPFNFDCCWFGRVRWCAFTALPLHTPTRLYTLPSPLTLPPLLCFSFIALTIWHFVSVYSPAIPLTQPAPPLPSCCAPSLGDFLWRAAATFRQFV